MPAATTVQPAGEGKDGTTAHTGPYLASTATTSRKRENQ